MRFDSKLMFSDGQSLSGTSGTSTNTLDLNKAGVSEGELYVILQSNCLRVVRVTSSCPLPAQQ